MRLTGCARSIASIEARSARQQAPEGSGLGLSIARTIVERHAGVISLAPGPGDRGCWARVVLPVQSR